jgi:hypothetical protein
MEICVTLVVPRVVHPGCRTFEPGSETSRMQ